MMANRFIQFFENSITGNWESPALTNYETKQIFAYKDMAREIAKLHILFKELNVRKDDKIALIGDNSPEWAIAFLAAITYGAVVVPIFQSFSVEDQENIINHSDASILFSDDIYAERLNVEHVDHLRAVFNLYDFRCIYQKKGETVHLIMKRIHSLFCELYPNGIKKEDVSYSEKDDNEGCVLNYTSGTTGNSKGVLLSGTGFCCMLDFAAEMNYGDRGHKVISMLPLAHMYGCVYDFLLILKVGGNIHFVKKNIGVNSLLKAFESIRPTWISTVPLVIETLSNNILSTISKKRSYRLLLSLPLLSNVIYRKMGEELMSILGGEVKKVFVAGAALDSSVENFLVKSKFPFVTAYGMTECSPLISGNYKSYAPRSVGKPITGVLVKINSDKPNTIPGEIMVKGNNLMLGYYKDSIATNKTFSDDGWLKTGDLGIMDKKGNIYIKGRLKSMILSSSGQNIYPEAIEGKFNKHPYVSESLIIQEKGKLVALIYPNYSVLKRDGISDVSNILEQHRLLVNKEIGSFEHISEIRICTSEFEKTPKSSIKRYLYE